MKQKKYKVVKITNIGFKNAIELQALIMKILIALDKDIQNINWHYYDLVIYNKGVSVEGKSESRSSIIINLRSYVDEKSDRLKSNYLSWIHDLGLLKIGNLSVIEYLTIRKDLSFWWMSSFSQKNIFANNNVISDSILLLAIEDIIDELNSKCESLTLISKSNPKLNYILKKYCRTNGINYICESNHWKIADNIFLYKIKYVLLSFMIFGVFVVRRLWSFREPISNVALTGNVTLIDVLVHFDIKKAFSGEYESYYWTKLLPFLNVKKYKINHLHLFYKSKGVKSVLFAQRIINNLNIKSQKHLLIDKLPTMRNIISAFKLYVENIKRSKRVTPIIKEYLAQKDKINLWELHKQSWIESIYGPNSLMELIRLHNFDEIFARIKCQAIGVYISENQPWEYLLINSWKRNGHQKIVSVPHAVIRYWDMRYYYSYNTYKLESKYCFQLPDFCAVNGPYAKNNLLSSGYPVEKIVEVEALRYMYLSKIKEKSHICINKSLKALICEDIDPIENDRILKILGTHDKYKCELIEFFYKEHPAFRSHRNYKNFAKFNIKIENRIISDCLQDYDLIICSDKSTIAVEAFVIGNYVIQVLNQRSILNLSPLRGLEGCASVGDEFEFDKAIIHYLNNKPQQRLSNFYFNKSVNLKRWSLLFAQI